jgi:hypothetical protein
MESWNAAEYVANELWCGRFASPGGALKQAFVRAPACAEAQIPDTGGFRRVGTGAPPSRIEP